MSSTLYHGGRVDAPGTPDALLAVDGRVGWLGAAADAPAADEVVDLAGGWVTPAFVDAHVHATAAGLALTGLDLAASPSVGDALDRLARYAADGSGIVLGTGWDETRWPERRAPTRAELDRAGAGRPVYLARTDVHSAVVSSALLAAVPTAATLPGTGADGLVTLDAHHACRRAAYALVDAERRRDAQRATLRRAAALGVGCVHEMAGPDISGEADLAGLLALAAAEPGPQVIGYWADLGDVTTPARHRLPGGAGDLFVDGTIGSRTAALRAPYADAPATRGELRYDATAVAAHVAACVRAGQQPGFHVIGDRAVDAVVEGLERAAADVGAARLRAARPRLEHVEMAGPDVVARLAALGVIVSVQPGFDAAWGGPAGMYAARLGTDRALPMNPFAGFAAAGVPLALGSDAPVTPIDPWGAVRAAVHHRTAGSGLDPGAAFAAATTGGWRAARVHDASGTLAVGAPATFAVWDTAGLGDALAATPACLRTVVGGRTVFSYDEGAAA